MLPQLNKFFARKSDRVICYSLERNRQISVADLSQDISNLRRKIQPIDAENWLLSSEDSYNFLVGFCALLSLERNIIICANQKLEWLLEIEKEFDATLNDSEFSLQGKLHLKLMPESSQKSVEQTQVSRHNAASFESISFSGEEKIQFFTSGSTGKAKKITKNLSCLTNELETLESTFGDKTSNTIYIASVSHMHIYGLLFRLLWPLLTNRQWLIESVEFPEQLSSMNNPNLVFTFISSPAFLSRLDLSLPSIRLQSFSSGGALSRIDANNSAEYFQAYPIEVYGSTETGGIGYRQQINGATRWTPFENLELKEVTGGILLESNHLEKMPAVLLDDELVIHADGTFTFKGRKDRVVKLGEKRVSLSEIERYLKTNPEIKECIAVVVKDKREIICCAIVLSEQGNIKYEQIGKQDLIASWKIQMKNRFDAVTLPRKWRFIQTIPTNSQSKVDQVKLIDIFQSREVVF